MDVVLRTDSLEDRLLSKVKVDAAGCFLWQAGCSRLGYGVIRIGNRNVPAHRAAFAVFRREVPDGIEVCHKCDVRNCINPSHLFLGTHADNMRDAVSKGRFARGAAKPSAVLTGEQVIELVQRYNAGELPLDLIREYGICKATLQTIVKKRKWTHLDRPDAVRFQIGARPGSTHQVKGVRHHNAKVNADIVRAIRADRKAGVKLDDLAEKYGIAFSNISRICLRKAWGHVL